MDLRTVPIPCGHHLRQLQEIYHSELSDSDKEQVFQAGVGEARKCVVCEARRKSSLFGKRRMKVKICVVGERSAEKDAVVSPFVRPAFDKRYIQTIGTQVSRKEIVVANPSGSGEILVDMTVWNVMGSTGIRQLQKEAYFYGSRGALCVFDGTRPDGLDCIDDWVSALFIVSGRVPTVFLVNRKEKFRENVIEESAVAAKAKAYNAPYFYTSTETGANVESAFQVLAERIVADRYQQASTMTTGKGE